jgi:hypothetical protein
MKRKTITLSYSSSRPRSLTYRQSVPTLFQHHYRKLSALTSAHFFCLAGSTQKAERRVSPNMIDENISNEDHTMNLFTYEWKSTKPLVAICAA